MISAQSRRVAIALGLSNQQIIEHLARITHDTIALEIENDNEKFLEKTKRTKQKIKFIKDEKFKMTQFHNNLLNCSPSKPMRPFKVFA